VSFAFDSTRLIESAFSFHQRITSTIIAHRTHLLLLLTATAAPRSSAHNELLPRNVSFSPPPR
jgi:hypothetical protein